MSRSKEDAPEPREFAIKDAAVAKFLYSPRKEDGSRDFGMEKKLSGLESTLAGLWPSLTTELLPLTKDVRKVVALFLATLYLRHPARRTAQKDVHATLVHFYESYFDALGEMPPEIQYVDRGKPKTISTSGFEKWTNATDVDHHRLFVNFLSSESIHLARLLLKKRWSVIFATEPVFVTSDEPVILEGPPERTLPAGFGTPGATVTFPISPFRLLRLDDQPGDDGLYYPLKQPTDVPFPSSVIFNCTVWVNAHRFMFSNRPSDQVIREIVTFVDWSHLDGIES
jgi:hypothetical protein